MGRKVSSVRDKDLKASAEAFYLLEIEQTNVFASSRPPSWFCTSVEKTL